MILFPGRINPSILKLSCQNLLQFLFSPHLYCSVRPSGIPVLINFFTSNSLSYFLKLKQDIFFLGWKIFTNNICGYLKVPNKHSPKSFICTVQHLKWDFLMANITKDLKNYVFVYKASKLISRLESSTKIIALHFIYYFL